MINIDLRLTLTPQERQAWQIVRPILYAYLRKIFRVYRNATGPQRDFLRAHNTVLDAVCEMLDE